MTRHLSPTLDHCTGCQSPHLLHPHPWVHLVIHLLKRHLTQCTSLSLEIPAWRPLQWPLLVSYPRVQDPRILPGMWRCTRIPQAHPSPLWCIWPKNHLGPHSPILGEKEPPLAHLLTGIPAKQQHCRFSWYSTLLPARCKLPLYYSHLGVPLPYLMWMVY